MAGNEVEVCKRNGFLNILGIRKHKVHGVFIYLKKEESLVPIETRGGQIKTEKYKGRIESVHNFIRRLKSYELHYSGAKSFRKYLDFNLRVSKMQTIYRELLSD